MHPLAVEKRQLHSAKVPSTVYRVELRSGETRTFTLPTKEQRSFPTSLEVREDVEGDEIHFRGHGAVFGRKSDDLGGFREVINPGAFKKILDANPDVRFMVNHDGLPLARTKNNTLDLREDPRGLHYYAKAADTTLARDLRILAKRGDIDQSSFAFSMGPESRERWEESEDGEIVRTVIEVDGLFDVSAVTYPAYPQADFSSVRELEPERAENVPTTVEEEREALASEASDDAVADEDTRAAEALKRRSELLEGVRRRLAIAKSR